MTTAMSDQYQQVQTLVYDAPSSAVCMSRCVSRSWRRAIDLIMNLVVMGLFRDIRDPDFTR